MTNNIPVSSNSSPSTIVSEFLPTTDLRTDPKLPTTTQGASVLEWREVFRPSDVPIPDGFEDIDTVVENLERDPQRHVALKGARQRLAGKLEPKVGGLAALRLRRGLSQKQLADAIGTSQPHIARIEKGRDNVLLATANQLARALGVTLDEVNVALGFEKKTA
jgi:DNA-binding XRE family transcriptional regulator